jgi:hypothetical protein
MNESRETLPKKMMKVQPFHQTCYLLSALLIGCSSGSSGPSAVPSISASGVSPSGQTDKTVLSHIDPNMPADQRAEIYTTLAALPESLRDNVVEFSGSNIYATTATLRDSSLTYQPTSASGVYRSTSGVSTRLPGDLGSQGIQTQSVSACGFDSCTGAAHVVLSSAGLSYFSSSVSIPCASTMMDGTKNNPGQAAYIYTGGTSSLGHQLDIGIQVNAPIPLGIPTSVQMFYTTSDKLAATVPVPAHLACNQTVQMSFWVEQTSTTRTNLILNIASNSISQTMIVPVTPKTSGWTQPCSNCTLKRVTGLAVPQNENPQLVTGTWFGINNPYSSSPTPTVNWTNATEGYFKTSGAKAIAQTKKWSETTFRDDPTTSGVIVKVYKDAANETIGINESGPHLILK